MTTNDSNLTALFKPFKLGRHHLKNRIVASPVFVGYALPNGQVSSFLIQHYSQLAGSGVGLVVVANAAVSLDGMTSRHNVRIDDDEYISGLTRLSKAIHKQGSLACLQLNHAGRFAKNDQPLLPSPIVGKDLSFNISSLKDFMNFFPLEQRFHLTQQLLSQIYKWVRPMSLKDIQRVIADFGHAARRAYQAGFDMVELHGATGYLINQFLSAFTNHREDEFGGSFSNRVAFPLAVIKRMKRCLPPDFPIGYRLLLCEWVPKGVDLQEAIALGKILEKENIAYLSATSGTHNSLFSAKSRKKIAPAAYLKKDIAELTAQINTPTIISGRITKPSVASRLIDEKTADLIGLGRPLRVDTDWLKKAGKNEKIRICINCGYCLRRVTQDQGFNCIQWPAWKQERTDLEHKMLTRALNRALCVINGGRDLEIFKRYFKPFASTRKESSDTILFLKPESDENFFTEEDYDFLIWCKGLYSGEGSKKRCLTHFVKPARRSYEKEVTEMAEKGGYGIILLGRIPGEKWRDRVGYMLEEKAIGIIGLSRNQNHVLVAIDLSPTSLLVLKYLEQIFFGRPDFSFDFVHVCKGSPKEAANRWAKLSKIIGCDEKYQLRLISSGEDASGVLMDLVKSGGYGTVVMGKRGLSGIKRMLLGSVSAHILRNLGDETLFLID